MAATVVALQNGEERERDFGAFRILRQQAWSGSAIAVASCMYNIYVSSARTHTQICTCVIQQWRCTDGKNESEKSRDGSIESEKAKSTTDLNFGTRRVIVEKATGSRYTLNEEAAAATAAAAAA